MRQNYLLLLFLLFACSLHISAQEVKATYEGKISSVEYVTSLASRPNDLKPIDNTPREAKDKRSLALEKSISIGIDPQTEDDYFVRFKNEQEQTMSLPPANLVFDTYSSNSQPTDPSLAVGPNHVLVVFNTGFAIYDKSGNQLVAPTAPNPAIFPSGGCCDLTASYDNAADRWVLSFLGSGAQVAVSDGPNPVTAGWYIYNISAIQDYQKLSVWSDAYYITENTSGANKVWALERSAMLTGNSNAKILGFNLPGLSTSGFFSPQVLNVTDSNLPAAGGATIVYLQDDAWSGVSSDHIKLWTLNVDWNTTSNSTMSSPIQIPTTPFISVFDGGSFSNLTQPGGGSAVDALQATIMNQAQFRKFPTHNSALFNFVVDTDASAGERAGIRWIELRQSGDNQPWSLYQEGTYTAPDGRHAWNASLAMDAQGNIGMGYTSMSGPTTPTTVRIGSYYTGRTSADPLGTMTGTEGVIATGNANFSGTRYGDYSKIDVDPANGNSFWFITEYMNSGRKGVVGRFEIQAGPPDTEAPSNPTNLTASNLSENSATLTWTASTDNVAVAQYNISINGTQVGTSGTNSYNVTGLAPSTTYTASVNAQDAAGNLSGSITTALTTLATSYCNSASTNINDEYIGRVQLNTLDNSSGGQFYSDFTAQSTNLVEGQSYTVTVTPTWTGTVYAEGYAVWIDYNNNQSFTDAGELVWSKAASTNTPNSGNFTVPSGTSAASVRMRVSMKYNGVPTSCETFTYGEVEDYTINLTNGGGGDTQPPSTPLNLTASNTTTNSTDLSWSASSDNIGVTGYEIFRNGTSIGTTTGTNTTVTGLAASTTYTFNLRAYDAAGNNSGLSNTASVTTTSGADTQAPSTPLNLTAFNVTDTTADLAWSASSDNIGVTGYEVFLNGSSIGSLSGTTATVTGLTTNTSYAFNVRAFDAAGNNSGLSNTANITTTGGGGTGGAGEIAAYYFETGFDGWSDGGSDCARVLSNTNSYEGSYSIRLRDNSSSSVTISPTLDLSAQSEVSIEFHVYAYSMENGEDFFVEFYNGSSYQVIGNYKRGTDFNNNQFFSDVITLNGSTYNFNTNNRIRLRCDASDNNDLLYFDQIIINGDNVTSATNDQSAAKVADSNAAILQSFTQLVKENIKIYPNPAKDIVNIDILEGQYDEVVVFSSTGKTLHAVQTGANKLTVDIADYPAGMYFVRFVSNGKATTMRFTKE